MGGSSQFHCLSCKAKNYCRDVLSVHMCLKECELWNASLALRGFICITPIIQANRSKSKSEPEWDSCCWGPRVHKNKHFGGTSVVYSSAPIDWVLVSRWWSPTVQMAISLYLKCSSLYSELGQQHGTTWPSRDLLQKLAPDPNQSSNIDVPNETRALLPILPETVKVARFPCCNALNFTLLNTKSIPLGLHNLKYREAGSD